MIENRFSALSLVKSLDFSDQTPDVVAHHMLIILALVVLLKFQHILVEALTMLFGVVSHIGFKEIHMEVHHVEFQGHSASHLLVGLEKIIEQLALVFFLVVTQKALNNCNEAAPGTFLWCQQRSEELQVLY